MRETARSLLAAAGAGVVADVLFGCYMAIVTGEPYAIVVWLPFSIVFVVVALLFGWPAYVIASSLGRVRWWWAVLAGAALGSVFAWLASDWFPFPAIGAVAGGAFWLILGGVQSPALRRR